MLKKTNKNSGMSLIEVIVSMLVLSIAVVAVTMSFSTASKINMGSKQKQNVEALMENLLEYAEAGGTDYKGWFGADFSVPEATTETTQQQTLYKGIKQGMQSYDVRVLVDTAPTEYEKDKLNNYDVIQFGGSSSRTIMIDASLASYNSTHESALGTTEEAVCDYDESAYKYFFNMNTSAVLEANLAGATPPLDAKTMAEIPDFVDRELRLVVEKIEQKMKLTANLTYTLDESILLPAAVSNVYERTLFVSELYDVASSTDPAAKKLNQIYIMYSPATLETVGYGKGQDIRVIDPEQAMKADIFIANQQTSSRDLYNAIGIDTISALDISTHTVHVSFQDPVEPSINRNPAGGNIYCSGNVALENFSTYASTTTCFSRKLVATGEEVRIVTTKLEILEAGTDKVLATKTVTHLQ